jgi:hypothetical protein
MLDTADTLLGKPVFFRDHRFVFPVLILTLVGSLFLLPAAGLTAPDSTVVKQLEQKAQDAFLKGDYAAAAGFDLEIAEKHPGSAARRYAVQMLGTIYEDNLIDIDKAIKWNSEYLEKYAGSRQVPFYQGKLASLQKISDQKQEQAFKTYQSIRSTQDSDEALVKKLEVLLKEYPNFLLKDDALHDLGYAYARLDQRKKSALAFQAISSNKLTSSDKVSYQNADRYWRMRTTWAWVAWAVIGMLWAVVLCMKPWERLTWASTKTFLWGPALWLLLTAASIPLFNSLETMGYPIQIPITMIFTASGLNLIVLFWLLLLMHGKFWTARPRALRWLSPVLALLMTTGVFYLFVVYEPNGPYTVDVCVVKYDYWKSELAELLVRHHDQGQAASVQDK